MTTLTTIFFNSANGAVIDNVKKNDDLYQIRLKGNKALPQLAKLTKIPRTIVLNDSLINEINNILLSEYSKNGYFWTKITIDTNIRKKQVVFNITENKPAMIAKVEFQGNEQIPTSKLSRLIKTDATFSQSVLTNQLNAVLRYYQNNGLPFANVEPINFVLNEENKRVSYTLKINEGKKVFISNVNFFGTHTPQARMQKIFYLKRYSLYNADQIDRLIKRIQTSNFRVIDYYLITEDTTANDTIYQLQIKLTEQKNQAISAAVSYLPEYKEFNGFFYLDFNNFLNTIRGIKIGWERYNRYTHFLLTYHDPYLLGFKLTSDINHLVFDTIYSKTDFSFGLKLPVTNDFLLNFYFGYNYIAGISEIQNVQTIWLGQGITLGDFNLFDKTMTNHQIDYSTLFGTKKTSPKNQLLAKTKVNAQFSFPIFHNTNYLTKFIFENLYANLPLSITDSLYVGGSRSLRGYREKEFGTNRYLLIQNELNLVNTINTLIFTFTDFAIIGGIPKAIFKLGYGIGLNIEQKNTSVSLSYGIPYPKNLLNGKIHLRLINKF